VNGVAGPEPEEMAADLEPLFQSIIDEVPPPSVDPDAPAQILVTNLDYDEHKGRICIGRVSGGSLVRPRPLSESNCWELFTHILMLFLSAVTNSFFLVRNLTNVGPSSNVSVYGAYLLKIE
jgi:hypothetical protein